MNPTHWTLVAYVAGLGLMWGYALALWWAAGRSGRGGTRRGGPTD